MALNSRLSHRSRSTAKQPTARRRSITRWRFARRVCSSAMSHARPASSAASSGSRSVSVAGAAVEAGADDDEDALERRRRAAFEMRTGVRCAEAAGPSVLVVGIERSSHEGFE